MKNKGFTLVELLGGIVIISIIALITIPLITGVINNARLNSLKNSAYGLLDATNLYYAQYSSGKILRFDIDDNKVSSNDTTKMISYKGNIKSGSLILDKNGKTTICITDGKNSAYKNYTESEVKLVEKQTCYIPENKSIVYLENDGATRSELSNQELTDLVANMQDKIYDLEDEVTALKSKNQELENNLETLKTQMETIGTIASSATLDKVYPIGSIYMSMTEDTVEKVAARFGGTWEKIENRFLYGTSGTSNQNGGTSSISYTPSGMVNGHTLTINEMPSHNHQFGMVKWLSNGNDSGPLYSIPSSYSEGSANSFTKPAAGSGATSYNAKGNIMIWPNGGSQPHSHTFTGTQTNISTMPPYTTVYMYKRIA